MDYWSKAVETRDQLVLFPTRLDDVIGLDHPVRMLDKILGRLDWSTWEKGYNLHRGQPPIHPRVLAGVILYGLMKRLRSSRALEEALIVRNDFRWLVEGRTIDHSTLSEFRRQQGSCLKKLFVQVGLVAREAGLLTLEQLAFDGTRIRANNRRSGVRTPEDLRKWRAELAEEYSKREQRMSDEDAREAALGALGALDTAELQRRIATIDAALAELDRVEQAGETIPSRIPLTDPQSRVTPNKEGGFAPNYTPLATVDTSTGLIVACDVIAMTNEEQSLMGQLAAVEQDFGLSSPVPEVLADGMMASGLNLALLEKRQITLYSPSKQADPATNPARRSDLTQSVPPEQWDALPAQKSKSSKGDEVRGQLTKDAFVYDANHDCYWCPQGQSLPLATTSTEKFVTGNQVRRRYKSDATTCATCPLRARCLKKEAKQREISRFEYDHLQEKLALRMATPEAQKKYARRRHVAERPFAMIKHHYGARRFLLRGLDRVRQEWCWLATAFNLERLMSLLHNRAGPSAATVAR